MDESRKHFLESFSKIMVSGELRIPEDVIKICWEIWQASRAAIEIDVEKLKIELETFECAQICLDEAGVPRKEGSEELSMWGRIVRYAAGIKVKE